ncbi:hypothetical protein DM01DRAFT_1334918 [Hesseltinella vesiculosa]|uniref:RRM domain-containing protein n=1 Tax=Hesseltinella vesiculosa TaxID=101127 RepID=A0A1X2GL46_9FUNG|nr:hypothetical protein DM01DRAFT_1334918 [Hesseltinella vesiculosa]
MATVRGSRVVFVGNIPFEFTEEQLIDVFKEVGPVASFRLLFDRESGRPKGYGFCEYYDAETAASAVRNLNNYELSGRQLRVDFASADDRNNMTPPPAPPTMSAPRPGPANFAPPGPPQPPAGPPSTEDITQILSNMTQQDLLTLLGQMKTLSMEQPDNAREFLGSNPSLAYALFQSMVMMNLVDPGLISRLVTAIPPTHPPPMQQGMPPPMPPSMQNMPPPMQNMPPSMQQGMPPSMQQGMPPSMQNMPPPPMQQGMPPPMQGAPLPGPNPSSAAEQQALLMQVLQLSDEQINNLAPEHREQVRLLKAQLMQ